jgi:hypothetical protein
MGFGVWVRAGLTAFGFKMGEKKKIIYQADRPCATEFSEIHVPHVFVDPKKHVSMCGP